MSKNIFWRIAQFFEIRWWKNYLSAKEKEDYYSSKKKYWDDVFSMLSDTIDINQKDTILDAGSGPAGIFINFPQNKITAVDPLLDNYEKELNHFSKSDFKNVQFINSPLEEYKSDEKFDFIFCLNVINHVERIGVVIQNLAMSLKDGGKLIFSVDCHHNNLLQKLFSTLKFDVLHPVQLTSPGYKKLFSKQKSLKLKREFIYKNGKIFDYVFFIYDKTGEV